MKVFIPLQIAIDRIIRLPGATLPHEFVKALRDRLFVENPAYLRGLRYGRTLQEASPYINAIWQDGDDYILPRGFTRPLINLCHQHRVDFEILDKTRTLPIVDLVFHGTLSGNQGEALEAIVKGGRFGMLAGPPGSGRKVTALALAAKRRQPVLVVVKTKRQLHQWRDLTSRFLRLPDSDIGQIGDGKQHIAGPVVLAIWDSLVRVLDAVVGRTGFLIVDDADHCGLKRLSTVGLRFDCAYTLGLTTGIRRGDGLSSLMPLHVGPILHQFDKPLNAGGAGGTRPVWIIRKTQYCYCFRENWQQMLTDMVGDGERNAIIVKDILAAAAVPPGRVLVLSERREHIQAIATMIRDARGPEALFIIGGVNEDRRRIILEQFRRGRRGLLMMTWRALPSVTIGSTDHVFMATPLRDPAFLAHALGVLLEERKRPNDQPAQLWDYMDEPVEVLRQSYFARKRFYQQMGFIEGSALMENSNKSGKGGDADPKH